MFLPWSRVVPLIVMDRRDAETSSYRIVSASLITLRRRRQKRDTTLWAEFSMIHVGGIRVDVVSFGVTIIAVGIKL